MFVARFVAAAFGMVAERATLLRNFCCATKVWCVISLRESEVERVAVLGVIKLRVNNGGGDGHSML